MIEPQSELGSRRWIPVKNVSGEEIPAFAACQFGCETDGAFTVDLPADGVSPYQIAFNGPVPIKADALGQVTRAIELPFWARCDKPDSGSGDSGASGVSGSGNPPGILPDPTSGTGLPDSSGTDSSGVSPSGSGVSGSGTSDVACGDVVGPKAGQWELSPDSTGYRVIGPRNETLNAVLVILDPFGSRIRATLLESLCITAAGGPVSGSGSGSGSGIVIGPPGPSPTSGTGLPGGSGGPN